MTQPIRVLIVDDHEIVREGLMTLLEDEQAVDVVGGAANGREALELAISLTPDVVLMDMALPDATGIDVTKEVRAACPKVQVIILTGNFGADLRVRDAMQAGAVGYLLKDTPSEEVAQAIRAVHRGYAQFGPGIFQKMRPQQTASP